MLTIKLLVGEERGVGVTKSYDDESLILSKSFNTRNEKDISPPEQLKYIAFWQVPDIENLKEQVRDRLCKVL